VEAAEQMLAEGAVTDAAQTFAAILGEDPENAAALAGLARRILRWDQLDQAEALLNNAPERSPAPETGSGARADRAGAAGRERRSAGRAVRRGGGRSGNHQARFDYAQALHASGQVEEAVEQLLELFRRDRSGTTGRQDAALHHLRCAEADRPDRAEGPPQA
jgi:putative thioredoxin